MRARIAASLLLVLCWLVLWPARASAEPPTYRFGSGSKGGGFAKIGEALSEGLAQTGDEIRIDVLTTKGSCDNIHQLLNGEMDFALVQYDVAAEAFKATRAAVDLEEGDDSDGVSRGFMCRVSAEEAQGAELRLLAALTDGAVHVLVRRPLRLDSFVDLAKHNVYIGKLGSGSYETAKVIVGAAGLTVDELRLFDEGTSAAFKALSEETVRVMLQTTEPGDDAIAKAVGSGIATVNPLPEDVLNRLIDGYPYYRVCQIEADTYPGLDIAIPTVCVSTVLLTALPQGDDAAEREAELDRAVEAMLAAVRWTEQSPEHDDLAITHRWRDFAEQEPIPLHEAAARQEQAEQQEGWLRMGATLLVVGLVVFGVRRMLKRRGLLKDPLEANLEGQLSNPLIPFGGFVTIVIAATFLVWTIEHDSNARVRTLNDSFWEMNMFATGNFSTDSLKSSTARFIGAAATIAGLGLLAWFTAALTNIFSRDQTRLFRRLRNHIVILNFREDMLQLIRMLRSPGPLRSRPIHVVVSDTLPRRVRLQLARVKGLTIHHQNPEVPEDLAVLRIPRAARVIVLQSTEHDDGGPKYHPLRIARAVHQACSKFEHQPSAQGPELGKTGFSVAPPLQHPALAGDDAGRAPSLPVTLAEAIDDDPTEIFDPFRRWLIPVHGRELADSWMATASVDPGFAEIFNGAVSFRDENSEVYTVPLPEWFHGRSWRSVRRTLYAMEERAGVIPLGVYRSTDSVHAYDARSIEGSSPQGELQKRLLVNPPLDLEIRPGDRLVAFAEDEADLVRLLRQSRRTLVDA